MTPRRAGPRRVCEPRWLALTALAVTLASLTGCAIPNYHQPHGFSSSYYRYLQRQQLSSAAIPLADQSASPVPPAAMTATNPSRLTATGSSPIGH